jgi:6,7-dimethyl-8-ribityllumazine synthase
MNINVIEGNLDARGLKFAIVLGRFNSTITDRLLSGALDALVRSGASESDIEVVRVPGSWEIPITLKTLAAAKRHDALIALSAVIRGDTPHFDYVAGQAASGIAQTSLESGIPIAFGVLTTNTVEQAMDRAGLKSGNKGFDAAMTAVEMANLLRRLRAVSS